MKFTGHPFIDAGIAGVAALLEQEDNIIIHTPDDLDSDDFVRAIAIARKKYFFHLAKKDADGKKRPLFYFLLQEILPGSPWDQVKTGKVVDSMKKKFDEYVKMLIDSMSIPSIGVCAITGDQAHVVVGKSEIPMLSSTDERPNCYPNLSNGFKVNAWIPLALLFSPLAIEKTLNEKGGGSLNLIYHLDHWRSAVAIAKRNIRRLNIVLSANSIEEFWEQHYGVRIGTWKTALMTLFHAINDIAPNDQPHAVIWSFNATNQKGQYQSTETSDSFVRLHRKRQLRPSAYRELPRCNDEVSRLILEGKPIVGKSIFNPDVKGKKNIIEKMMLIPGWALQRLYAEEVQEMPVRLLNTIENAAVILAADKEAVNYCLFETIRPTTLAKKFKLPIDAAAIFADYPMLWRDYLRAAVLWIAKGNTFARKNTDDETPGQVEAMIKDVSKRMVAKYNPKRIAMMLTVRIPNEYRNKWIRLLSDGACTWDDFLSFNPLDEALSIGGYARTHILRDYLVAFLFGLSRASGENDVEEETEFTEEELSETLTIDQSEEQEEQ